MDNKIMQEIDNIFTVAKRHLCINWNPLLLFFQSTLNQKEHQ